MCPCIHVCICVCACVCTWCVRPCASACACAFLCVHVRVCIHVCVCVFERTAHLLCMEHFLHFIQIQPQQRFIQTATPRVLCGPWRGRCGAGPAAHAGAPPGGLRTRAGENRPLRAAPPPTPHASHARRRRGRRPTVSSEALAARPAGSTRRVTPSPPPRLWRDSSERQRWSDNDLETPRFWSANANRLILRLGGVPFPPQPVKSEFRLFTL